MSEESAEERRARRAATMTATVIRPGEREPAERAMGGLEGLALSTKITCFSYELAGRPVVRLPRHEWPVVVIRPGDR